MRIEIEIVCCLMSEESDDKQTDELLFSVASRNRV
jgi:hypothetical protein